MVILTFLGVTFLSLLLSSTLSQLLQTLHWQLTVRVWLRVECSEGVLRFDVHHRTLLTFEVRQTALLLSLLISIDARALWSIIWLLYFRGDLLVIVSTISALTWLVKARYAVSLRRREAFGDSGPRILSIPVKLVLLGNVHVPGLVQKETARWICLQSCHLGVKFDEVISLPEVLLTADSNLVPRLLLPVLLYRNFIHFAAFFDSTPQTFLLTLIQRLIQCCLLVFGYSSLLN